jgi:DNA-binding phage protein
MLVTPAKNMDRFTPEAAEEAVQRVGYSLSCMGFLNTCTHTVCAVGAYVLDKTGDVDKSRGLIDKAMDDSLDERLHDRGIYPNSKPEFSTVWHVAKKLDASFPYLMGLNDGFENWHTDRWGVEETPEYKQGYEDGRNIACEIA